MNSREEFIQQVAKAITDAQNDSKRKESFIFGLSAKWGEGKTTFLEGLKIKLKDTVIVEINPWKYSDNKVTFLQSFLLALLDSSNITLKDDIRDEILMTKTENRIEMKKGKWWLILIVVAFVVSIALNLLPQFIPLLPNWVISVFQFTGTIAIIPWMMNHFEQMVTSTVTDKTTSALINFDETLTKILSKYSNNIIIYVDDLDRISARNAVLVLDNLRTFFDKKELCFIVSGDHSVMERHIGKELLPDGETEAQMEEGRRYLKKVFNIYWRMPIPTDAEIERYISDIMGVKLQDFALTDEENGQLAALLNKLFENNYRNIERMTSQIAFTLQIVQGKLASCNNDDETRIYYEDLLQHKMLLVKVLLIQELANPYYELLLSESDCLRESDKTQRIYPSLDDKHSGDSLIVKMTHKQRTNLEVLIKTFPKFHGENGLAVYDMKPFIFLSADSNFGDNRGLLPSEFHGKLSDSLSDLKEFEKLLQQHSIEMLHKGIAAMIMERKAVAKDRPQPSASIETAQELTALIKSLGELEDEYEAQKQEFKAYFDPEVISEYIGLNNSIEYSEMVFSLGELYKGDMGYANSLLNRADNITAKQFSSLVQFAEDKEINILYENVIWSCFSNLAAQNLNSFITQFESIVDKLDGYPLQDDVLTALVARIQNNSADASAVTAAKIITKSSNAQFIDDAIGKARALLPQRQPLLLEILRTLDADNCDSHALSFVEEASTYQDLCVRIQFVTANNIDADAVWHHVIETKFDMLVANVAQQISNPKPPSPSATQAKLLAQKVIRYARDNAENPLLTSITTSAFLFANLESIKGETTVTRYLGELKKSGDTTNSENAKRLLGIGETDE